MVVVGIVLMALFMFWGAEHLERIFGGRDLSKEPKWRLYAGGGLLGVALLVALIGQPTTDDRWARMAETETARLTNREVQIHPAELAKTMTDDTHAIGQPQPVGDGQPAQVGGCLLYTSRCV